MVITRNKEREMYQIISSCIQQNMKVITLKEIINIELKVDPDDWCIIDVVEN